METVKQIKDLDQQIQGIIQGYNKVANKRGEFELSNEMMMIIQYDGGIDNILEIIDMLGQDIRFDKKNTG